jgi:molybdate-binding protein
LRIAASPDPVLLGVLGDWPEIELTTMGSLAAIDRLFSGAADAAGVHFGLLDPSAEPAFAVLAADASLAVKPLLVREQGLMLAPGNPLAIRSVRDLAASKARFVNRQRGSGTRLWFDRLLAEAAIPATAIAGYEVEEFTHQAVAAVIAAGAADAGMGARAVAERFGLAFEPIGHETYFLCHRRNAETPVIQQIVRQVREQVRDAVGYKLPAKERRPSDRG